MHVSMVAAMTQDRVIGREGQLPWHLPADLWHFKRLTVGRPVIMGRKTYESVGRPLPKRINIVMTRDSQYEAAGCEVVQTAQQALELATKNLEGDHAAFQTEDYFGVRTDEIMILGGAEIYAAFMPLADRLYLTWIEADCQGDAYFPEVSSTTWRESHSEAHAPDDRNPHRFRFVRLVRKGSEKHAAP